MQRCAPGPVGNIHIAEQGDQRLGTADRLVGRGDVQRRLPVLVTGVDVRRVFQQHLDGLLLAQTGCGWDNVSSDEERIVMVLHVPHCRTPRPGAEESATCCLWHSPELLQNKHVLVLDRSFMSVMTVNHDNINTTTGRSPKLYFPCNKNT